MRLYTVTRINEWNQCELKYYGHHIEKYNWEDEISGSNLNLLLGELVHEFFEKFYVGSDIGLKFKKNIIQLGVWKDEFVNVWNEKLSENNFFVSSDEAVLFLEKGLICLENFYKREKNRDFKIPIYLEQKFNIQLGDYFRLSGKIDRIDQEDDGSIKIIDYKITNKTKTVHEAYQDRQLAIYAFACNQTIMGKSPSLIGWYYPLKDLDVFVEPELERQEQILSEILQIETLTEQRGKEKTLYKASPSTSFCDYCGYRDHCPENNLNICEEQKEPIDENINSIIEEATLIHAQIKPLEKRLEELKTQIKQYMTEQNMNKLNNVTLQMQEKGEYSPEEIWELLKNVDNGYDFIKIKKTALKDNLSSFSLKEQKQINNAYIEKKVPVLRIKHNKN